MNRIEKLLAVFKSSGLDKLFLIKKECDYPDNSYSALRFESNDFRIRSIEIWDKKRVPSYFRIYHSDKMAIEIKEGINEIDNLKTDRTCYSDFEGDYFVIAEKLATFLNSSTTRKIAENNIILTKNSKYDGLSLPDIDTNESEIFGRVFTWREIIAIDEDESENNFLKKSLSQNGVYLQRSNDGKSRYVGSAYGEGGILGRWLKHLTSNGHAKHLNLFILENGYANIEFTVLEILDDPLENEQKWKSILGTKNTGPYDGLRLNNN